MITDPRINRYDKIGNAFKSIELLVSVPNRTFYTLPFRELFPTFCRISLPSVYIILCKEKFELSKKAEIHSVQLVIYRTLAIVLYQALWAQKETNKLYVCIQVLLTECEGYTSELIRNPNS